MSEEELKIYKQAEKGWQDEAHEQDAKDQKLLDRIKCCISGDIFAEIEFQLEESENPSNYRIVDEPIGEIQSEGAYNFWIIQSCGDTGDNFSGTICMELSIGKYLMWDFWM